MRAIVFGLLLLGGLGLPARGDAHPLGNFSISQYTGLRIRPDGVELRYVIDLAEIPTFQEIWARMPFGGNRAAGIPRSVPSWTPVPSGGPNVTRKVMSPLVLTIARVAI